MGPHSHGIRKPGAHKMSTRAPAEALDQAIGRLKRRMEGLQLVRDLLADDPQFAIDLQAALAGLNGNSGDSATNDADDASLRLTIADRVIRTFGQYPSKWRTVREIGEAAGLDRGAVGFILYKSRADRFEQKDHPGSRKLKLWRLKQKGGETT